MTTTKQETRCIVSMLAGRRELEKLIRKYGRPYGEIVQLLQSLGRIEVVGLTDDKVRIDGKGTIYYMNHPSIWEVIIFPGLFYKWYCRDPACLPISVADRLNFKGRKWMNPIEQACIFLPRSGRNRAGERISREKMAHIREQINYALFTRIMGIKNDSNFDPGHLVLCPEGGRSFKSKKHIHGPDGRFIGSFTIGLANLLIAAQARCVPVWVDDGGVMPNKIGRTGSLSIALPRLWRKTRITFGDPIEFTDLPSIACCERARLITDYLEQKLLYVGK